MVKCKKLLLCSNCIKLTARYLQVKVFGPFLKYWCSFISNNVIYIVSFVFLLYVVTGDQLLNNAICRVLVASEALVGGL